MAKQNKNNKKITVENCPNTLEELESMTLNHEMAELEDDELEDIAPTSFQTDTEPTTLLEAIDNVNIVLDNMKDGLWVFDCSYCHGNNIDYLVSRLHITPIQAALFSLCVELSPNSITYSDLACQLNLSKARAMALAPHLDGLVRDRLMKMEKDFNGRLCYNVPFHTIRVLTTDSDFQPPRRKVKNDEDLLDYFHGYLNEVQGEGLSHMLIQEEVEALLDENKGLHIVEEINKIDLDERDRMLLLFVCERLVVERENEFTMFDMDDLFPNRGEFQKARDDFRAACHNLISAGLLEHTCNNGIVNPDVLTLSQAARKTLLSDIKMAVASEKVSGLVAAKSLQAKELFYSEKVAKQVDGLRMFLERKKYKEIMKRLGERFHRGGLTVLLHGGPGTGKTETVYQLARQTGRDIMAVDVSSIKSKWVGETEQNIKALFDRYRAIVKKSKVAPILLFNEADAIFGVRMSGATRSVDKMMNSMQNIILQEMETLDGILIATTNLTENLDKAFDRRFLYRIEFERPDKSVRARIWHQMLPELEEHECQTLAEGFDFSGGQIENVARKFAINSILYGEPTGKRLETLTELCSEENQGSSNGSHRVGFVA